DLDRAWTAEHFVGAGELARRWERHPEWVDGYLNYLPFGPPPMRNETCYVYRTISAPRRMAVEMRIYALDNIRAWLNGTVVAQAMNPGRRGSSRFAASLVAKLNLKAGANRLLVKITSMHGKRGFSFAMPPFTPSNGFVPGRGIRSVRPRDDALARLREFRFDVTPIPMYDPARLRMAEELEKNVPGTQEGNAYLRRLAALREKLRPALDLVKASSPAADDPTVARAAKAIDEFWADEIRRLPPVAFLKCPPHRVNAIAPIITGGTRPSSICVLDPSKPTAEPRVVYHDPRRAIFDVNVSYDAKTLLFSASGGAPGGWHVYEIGVDGKGAGQITGGNCSDMMPVLLPNDEIMFVSDRAGTVVVCQPRRAGILYVCYRDGSNVRRVSGNTLSDHTPQVMNDGRVIFTRWDYGVDKNVFCRQNLWTMNPDGTRFQLFGSNTKEDPNAFWKAQPIPGRPEVVCVFGPHHNYHAGMIGLVWDRPVGYRKDLRGEGFRWVTRELPTYGDITLPWGYRDPFPLNEHLFLVSYGGDGGGKSRRDLLDDRGNRKLLHEDEGKPGCRSERASGRRSSRRSATTPNTSTGTPTRPTSIPMRS
ncbi:MAG: TolB family protein, partial [Planctomycetota bacterium]